LNTFGDVFWQIAALDRKAFILFGSLAFISFSVNPFIYASRYEVFRRYLKQMLNKNVVTSGNRRVIVTPTVRIQQ